MLGSTVRIHFSTTTKDKNKLLEFHVKEENYMKGRKLTLVLVMLLVLVCSFALTACHEHECETAWTYDNAGHWHKATCKHTEEKIDYAAHTLFSVDAKAATCTEAGSNQYYICVCGAAFKDEAGTTPTYAYAEVVPAKGHVYDQKVASPATLAQAATCTSKAVYYYTCSCGAVGTDTFESGEFTAHNLQLVPAVEANCMQAGSNAYYKCADCNAYFRDEAATMPTSPEAEVLPVTAHTPVYHAGVAATCTQEGKTEYWTCSVCSKMYEDAYCTSEITSVRTIPTIPHTYSNVADEQYKVSDATCQSLATYNNSCTACGARGTGTFTFGTYAAHVLTEVEAVAPTCSTPGSNKYYTCSVCEKHYTDLTATVETTPDDMIVPSIGHTYDQEVVKTEYLAKAATCQEIGLYYKSCVCGRIDKNESETFQGGAKGQHIPGSVVPAVAATCTVDGNIEYSICAVCSKNFHVVSEEGEHKVVVLSDGYVEEGGVKIKASHTWAEIVDAKCLFSRATCETYASYYLSCSVCGEVNKELEPFKTGTLMPHTLGDYTARVEATCTTVGNVAYAFCSVCQKYVDENGETLGASLSDTEIATPNDGKHDYTAKATEEYLYQAATCASSALYYKSCKNCGCKDMESEGDARFFEYGDPLPHVFGEFVARVEATCTEDGNIKYCVCSECEGFFDEDYKSVNDVVIGRKGHTPVENPTPENLATPATCTAKATYYQSCADCGHKFEVTFQAGEYKEHEYGQLIEGLAPTCDEEGKIAYYECSACHQYFNSDKNVVTTLTISPLGHKILEIVLEGDTNLISAATCKDKAKYDSVCERCHKTNYEILGEQRPFEVGDRLEHNYGTLIAEVPATCDTKGTIAHYQCSACSQYFNAEKAAVTNLDISPLGHKYIEVVDDLYLDTEATCVQRATYVKFCERCEKTSKEINATNYETFESGEYADHEYGSLIAALAPECDVDGHVAHYKCGVCSKVFNEEKALIASEVVAKLGHDYTAKTDAYLNADATCTEAATYFYACSRCDAKGTETYEKGVALGHNVGAMVTGFPATCTTDGEADHFYCDRCNEYLDADKNVIETTVIAALGHDRTKKIVSDAWNKSVATCAEAAVYYYACSRCDTTEVDANYTYTEGAALPHDFSDGWIPEIVVQCTVNGQKAHYECKNCHQYFDANKNLLDTIVIECTGHDFTGEVVADAFVKSPATCIAKAVYYYSCTKCKAIHDEGLTFVYGEVLATCAASTLQHVPAKTEFDFAPNEFPAKCNYEHWICTLCNEKIYADAEAKTPFVGDPYYILARRTMAIGKMVDGKFDVNVDTTLAHATGYSYTIGGIVPYVKGNWGQEGLVGGNRVAIQFAAKYFEYAKTQTGVIARLTSGSYVKEFMAIDLQAGDVNNNIEAGSLLAIFNVAESTDIKLEILTETGFVTYTFKLATSIEMIKFMPETEATYWNPGNHEYYVLGEEYFKDGFAKEAIADISSYLIDQLIVDVQLGTMVDDQFVVAGADYAATLTGTNNNFLLEGAILTSKDGYSYFTIRLNADLASYFTYVAENEVVLKVVLADGTLIESKLPDFDFAADGTFVKTFKVEAGKSYTVALRSPKSVITWLTFNFEVDADFVCPTLVEGVAATYWANGISDHYTLTDELGVVTHYEDILCTKEVEVDTLIAKQLELAISAGNSAYAFERNDFAKYTLNGIVAFAEGTSYPALIKVANAILAAYEGCEDTLVVAKINGVEVTLAQLATLVEEGIAMEASKGETFTIAIINPKNAEDVVTYEFAVGSVYCPKFIEEYAATYFAIGMASHYKCALTGKFFADANCTQELTEAELATDKLIPTAQAGSYDTANNAFVLGGVYYSVAYDKALGSYVLSGSVVSNEVLPAAQYRYGYVLRFNDNFANLYTALEDTTVVVRVKFADNNIVEFTKANAFEADGTIVFRGDAAYQVVEFALWNTVTNDWETYEITADADFNRIAVLADAQVGSFDSTGAFLVGYRYVYNSATKAFDKREELRYTVAVNENAEYVISGIVPSAQDKNGKDNGNYDFSLRFNFNFAQNFTNVADDVVVLRYVAPDGTEYASYTKAQVFANEISVCFTGSALVDGNYKCQILNEDGSVWMEYRIRVAADVVCPVYMYETAPNYWGQGWAQHYQNARVEGRYYKDYDCTVDYPAEELFTEKRVFDGMTVGAYVASESGYKFGTYDHIEYNINANEQGVYVINGRIPCWNDMRDTGEAKKLHKFVVKLNGIFQNTYDYYASTNNENTVIAKVTIVVDGEQTIVEIQKKDVLFEADGSIVFIYEAIKGAEISLDLMNPISGEFGGLVYSFYVDPAVIYTHDVKYHEEVAATYWTEGTRSAVCEDCAENIVLDAAQATIAKLLPVVKSNGADVANVGGSYTVNVANGTFTVQLDMAQFASFADNDVVLTIGTQTWTKAELAALNGIVEITITSATTLTISIANPSAGGAAAEYTVVVVAE